ncbi:MAG: hypothetical protein ABI678_24000 [Kofleriaceae bacterium]
MKIALISFVALAACSPYSPDLGYAPFLCGASDPKCPDGYDCMADGSAQAMVCVKAGGTAPDAGSGSGSGGQCADDSNLEPNNTVAQAYLIGQLPVINGVKTITLAGLSICPMGDKDTYAVNPTASSQTLSAEIEFDPNQAVLQVNVINGTTMQPIVSGSPNGEGKNKVALANVPTGGGPTYVQVIVSPVGGGSLTTNGNYKLTLTLTP